MQAIYYIPTFENDPTPCTSHTSQKQNKEEGAPTEGETLKEEWDSLTKLFNKLEIKKIILSGAYYDEGGKDIDGCINFALSMFTKLGFKAFVSNVVSPHPDR